MASLLLQAVEKPETAASFSPTYIFVLHIPKIRNEPSCSALYIFHELNVILVLWVPHHVIIFNIGPCRSREEFYHQLTVQVREASFDETNRRFDLPPACATENLRIFLLNRNNIGDE